MRAEREDALGQGLLAGFIGYATVALSVGIADVAQGRSFFYTAALLGESLFYGLRDPGKVIVWPGGVFAYNGLHLLVFLVIGVTAAALAVLAERGPELWYGAFVLFLLVAFHAWAAVQLLTEPVRAAIPTWEIWVPSVLSGVAMLAYLVAARPRLRHALGHWEEI